MTLRTTNNFEVRDNDDDDDDGNIFIYKYKITNSTMITALIQVHECWLVIDMEFSNLHH